MASVVTKGLQLRFWSITKNYIQIFLICFMILSKVMQGYVIFKEDYLFDRILTKIEAKMLNID